MSKRPSASYNDPGYFYNPRRLMRIFAVSGAVLLAATAAMIWADYARPWKADQLEAQRFEAQKLGVESFLLDTRVQDLRRELAQARGKAEAELESLQPELERIRAELEEARGLFVQADTAFKAQKQFTGEAEYNVTQAESEEERERLREVFNRERDEEMRLRDAAQQANARVTALVAEEKRILGRVAEAESLVFAGLDEEEAERKRQTLKRLELMAQNRKSRASYNPVRNIPLLDFLAPPARVEQVVLDHLVDDYEFATPKKVDRCATCHLGAARIGFEKEKWPVEILELQRGDPEKIEQFEHAVYEFAYDLLESTWPKVPRDAAFADDLEKLRSLEIHHETLSMLFAEYDRETGSIGLDDEGRKKWKHWQRTKDGRWIASRSGEGLSFEDLYLGALLEMEEHWRTHPHDGLMVGGTSAHPYETFGCTTCHQGRGWSVDFGLAWHTPPRERSDAWMTTEYAEAYAAGAGKKKGYHVPVAPMTLEEAMAKGNVEGYPAHVGWVTNDEIAREWAEEHGRSDTDLKYWDWPQHERMLVQSSCLKCHKEGLHSPAEEEYEGVRLGPPAAGAPDLFEYEEHAAAFARDPELAAQGQYADRLFLPEEPEEYRPESLLRGMDGFLRFGCYGCHKLDPVEYPFVAEQRAKVGPQLDGIAAKTTKEWAAKWVENPKAYRPHTRMPRFWGLSNNSHEFPYRFAEGEVEMVDGEAWADNEVYAIVEWLWEQSAHRAPSYAEVDLSRGDPARGEKILIADYEASDGLGKACIACHDVPIRTPELQYDREALKSWKDPRTGEAFGWGERMSRRHGPDLAGIGSKVDPAWLVAWLLDPKGYWHDTNMPDLRLTEQEALDVAAYLMTLKAEEFDAAEGPVYDAGIMRKIAQELRVSELAGDTTAALAEVERWTPRERTLYAGRTLFKHYGCFGCHEVEAYAGATPIGTELTTWGSKLIDRLEFNHAPVPHTRFDFAYTKLVNPRIYDWGVPRADRPYDRLKMPRFVFTAEEAKDIATFLVALVDQTIPEKSRFRLDEREQAVWKGRWIVRESNCQACHVIEGEGGDVWPAIPQTKWQPPNLLGQGAKVQPGWLMDFLREPYTVRPWHSIHMPTYGFTPAETEALVHYFAALSRAPYPFPVAPADGLTGPDGRPRPYAQPKTLRLRDPDDPTRMIEARAGDAVEEAALMFQAYQCQSCHSDDPSVPIGNRAPLFDHTREGRLRPDWIETWLWQPSKLQPGTAMPSFFTNGQVQDPQFFGGDAAAQIRALRDFIRHHYGKPQEGSR